MIFIHMPHELIPTRRTQTRRDSSTRAGSDMASRRPRRSASAAKATTRSPSPAAADSRSSSSTPSDLLRCWIRIWALQQALRLGVMTFVGRTLAALLPGEQGARETVFSPALTHAPEHIDADAFGSYAAHGMDSGTFLIPVVLLAVARPTVRCVVLAHAGSLTLFLVKLPLVWDYEFWDFFSDVSIVACGLAVLLAERSGRWTQARERQARRAFMLRSAKLVRAQYCVFYLGAGIWKLNTSFFNTSVSCGPIFFLQLLDKWLPSCLVPAGLVVLVAATAPLVTAVVELLLPTLLAQPGRVRGLGIALGLVFHLLIAITPPPNNAGCFSVAATVRYFFFCPHETAAVVEQLATPGSRLNAAAAAAVVLGVLVGAPAEDWAIPTAGVLAVLYSAALWRSSGTVKTDDDDDDAKGAKINQPGRRLQATAVALAVTYTFVLPVLGLQDMGASTMFANLRVFSGSNHFFLPTSLAFHDEPSEGAFGNGLVRVIDSSSTWIREMYPTEATGMLTPRVRRWVSTARSSAAVLV